MLLEEVNAPERVVISQWAEGFLDRDGKFIQEFQLTFESGFWELYLHAVLKTLGMQMDMTISSPDFVITAPSRMSLEATIAAPAIGGKPAYGYNLKDMPKDFTDFNIQSTLRICNSFDSKFRRYQNHYSLNSSIKSNPYVIGIGAFDRPLSHFSAGRSILAAIYGLYYDEAATHPDASAVVSYNVSAAPKSAHVNVPVGLFCDDTYADVSAVLYSSLATWGKLRALSDNPSGLHVFNTFHTNESGLLPIVKTHSKSEYQEDLLDGLYVLHNPFAKNPLPVGTFSHSRVKEIYVSSTGELEVKAPKDFLLVRTVATVMSSNF